MNDQEWAAYAATHNIAYDRVMDFSAQRSASTLYGTIPLPSMFPTFEQRVHLTLPRDLDKIDPTIVKLLRPYMEGNQ